MGWNHETADWSVVTGALFPGGASAPGFWDGCCHHCNGGGALGWQSCRKIQIQRSR